jgi:type II secretory pathway component PulF
MRGNKEIADEALRRAALTRKEKSLKKQKLYAVLSVAACIAVIVGLSYSLPSFQDSFVSETPNAASAAMLAGAGVGGYVLIGIVGFILGAVITLFYIKRSKKD